MKRKNPNTSITVAPEGTFSKEELRAQQIAVALFEFQTDQGRRRWLFEFANRNGNDLLQLSAEQLRDVYARLFVFAVIRLKVSESGGSEMFTADPDVDDVEAARAWLFQTQEALRSGLRQVIKLDNEPGFDGWQTDLAGIERFVKRGRSVYQGKLRPRFLAAVADLIAEDREKRIEMCAKPTCERFFWKVEGAKYCSRSCADADRQSRWRHREEES